jgi:hypothetical protein
MSQTAAEHITYIFSLAIHHTVRHKRQKPAQKISKGRGEKNGETRTAAERSISHGAS